MKTNFKNTKKISAILFASAIIFSSISAQSSNTMPTVKFVSFANEDKSNLVYEKLNELTKAIEEKIKFRAPIVNENEMAAVSQSSTESMNTPGNYISDDDKNKSKRAERSTKEGASNLFRNWVESNLEYQLEGTDEQVSGTVVVSFIINTKGKVSHVKIITPSNNEVDEIAVDLIKNAPRRVMKNMVTQPVKEKFILPISYNVTM
jgi:TonB family protein